MKNFAQLFKKYRLRGEFETIASFGDALAEEGYFYEESIFSHWQKGTRMPSDRKLVLVLIKIFVQRKAIQKREEANELLESTGLGYLTEAETKKLQLDILKSVPFFVPHESADFIGRGNYIEQIKKEIKKNKVIFISGQSGVGKTTLAIKLGHILQKDYPDGVLWFSLDTTKIQDIFFAIAYTLEEKIPENSNVEIIASFIRAILARKRILLMLDNVEKNSNVHLLLPNPPTSSIIILSKQKDIYLPANVFSVSLQVFTNKDVINLFCAMFNKSYIDKNKQTLISLAKIVGFLPLAVQLLAAQVKRSKENPRGFLASIEREHLSLQNIWYENKNLYLALNISYKNLSKEGKAIFLSLGIFEGKDFSIDAIAYMNGLTEAKTREILDELYNASLIELSLNNKYRIHTMVKKFINEKMNNPYLTKILWTTLILFGIFTIYWIILHTQRVSISFNYAFGDSYFVIPLWGSLWGFFISKKWGGMNSIIGKTLAFFSLGLFFQTIGQVIYSSYDFLFNIQVPYPSLGDIFYFGCIFIYCYAIYLLAKLSGIKVNMKIIRNHKIPFILSLIFLTVCLGLLLQDYVFFGSNPLKIFLDFSYPVGDWLYTFFALLIWLNLKNKKGSTMKNKVLFFFVALLLQFLSDYVFVYQANNNTWQVGNLNDYMYLSSYLLMTLAILRFDFHLSKILRLGKYH